MNKQKLFSCSVLITVLSVSSYAEVATATLKNLIIYSKVIVVGKVVKVSTVENLKIAEVEVIEVLKGQFNNRILYYRANPLGACDVSGGKEQEIGIYFFSDQINISALSKEDPEFVEKLKPVTQNPDFFNLTWDGQGRLLIKSADRNRVVSVYIPKGEVFPTSDKVEWKLTNENLEEGVVRFEDVISYIKAKNN